MRHACSASWRWQDYLRPVYARFPQTQQKNVIVITGINMKNNVLHKKISWPGQLFDPDQRSHCILGDPGSSNHKPSQAHSSLSFSSIPHAWDNDWGHFTTYA
jgi:hypothetical protein